jgi:hypothetical protein
MRLDLESLLRLRAVVARVGEQDLSHWWNTEGQLGPTGEIVLRRGFRRTYRFAQARSVFAVAAARCRGLYDRPGTVTLWRLPAQFEDEFNLRWPAWLNAAEEWEPFFADVAGSSSTLEQELLRLGLVTSTEVEEVRRLRRSAEGAAVEIPGTFSGSANDLRLLALGFARGEHGAPCVPYQTVESA